MEMPWRIELLGWLRAARADRTISRFRSCRAGILFAYLAYYRHRSHPREVLVEILWPGSDPQASRRNLRVELTSLRRQLELPGVASGSVILADPTSVQLNPAACTLDTAAFEAKLQSAGRASSAVEQARRLSEALELYRGELLPGYFDDWILRERQRLAEAYQRALGQMVTLMEAAGDLPRALQFAKLAVMHSPLAEEAHDTLIRLLVATGQPEAALRQYQELDERLQQELGATPGPGIRDFASAIAESAREARWLRTRTQAERTEEEALRQQLSALAAEVRAQQQQLAAQSSEMRELRTNLAQVQRERGGIPPPEHT